MRLFSSTIVLLCLLLACNKSTLKRPSQQLPPRVPAAIIVEREIGGPILHVPLSNPIGLANDFRGDIYLCDRGNNRIIKFRSDISPVGDRGGYGSQPGLFNEPSYVTVDNQLNLWVSDSRNRRIVRMDADLNFVDQIPFSDPNDPFAFGVPSGMAVTSFGSLWVADPEKDRLAIFDNVGQFEKFAGDFGASGGQLQNPTEVVNAYDEAFYVCDPGNSRVAVYDSYGSFTDALTDPAMLQPVAMTIDSRSVVWVIDQQTSKIFCFDSNGRNLLQGGRELMGQQGRPVAPASLVFVGENKLLISDAGANRLLLCNIVFE